MLRDFLDSILQSIEAASLSDVEWLTIDLDSEAYDAATYNALKAVLESRENVSIQVNRLKLLFQAHGVYIVDEVLPTPNSNIFIGSAL